MTSRYIREEMEIRIKFARAILLFIFVMLWVGILAEYALHNQAVFLVIGLAGTLFLCACWLFAELQFNPKLPEEK